MTDKKNEGNKNIVDTLKDKLSKNTDDYRRQLDVARKIFIGLLGVLVTILMSSDLVNEVIAGSIKLTTVMPVLLVIATLGLGLLWLISAEHELNILKTHIGMYIPEIKFSPVVLSYTVPIFIVVLAALSTNLIIYSIIYWIYLSVDVVARKTVTTNVYTALTNTNYSFNKKESTNSCFYNFYIKRPFEARGYFMGTATLIVIGIAILDKYFQNNYFDKDTLLVLAYSLQILVIFLGEISIWLWRKSFYDCVAKYEENK